MIEADRISVAEGRLVKNFDEYTFRAPRPGLFLGDSRTPRGEINPVKSFQLDGADTINLSPNPRLGSLDHLATEVIQAILLKLDIPSLLAFRHVSARARDFVDSLLEFKTVSSFPHLLGAISALDARAFDLETIHYAIRDPTCGRCANFGDLLYLMTGERLCYKCWRSFDSYISTPYMLGGDRKDELLLIGVPAVRLSPGYYGGHGGCLRVRKTSYIFDRAEFYRITNAPNEIDFGDSDTVPNRPSFYSYVATIRAPYFDAETRSLEEGFLCQACAQQGDGYRLGLFDGYPTESVQYWGLPWRRYTRSGMRAHLEKCGRIFQVPDESHHSGSRYVHDGPFLCQLDRDNFAEELHGLRPILERCRAKEISIPLLQPILSNWHTVSSNRAVIE